MVSGDVSRVKCLTYYCRGLIYDIELKKERERKNKHSAHKLISVGNTEHHEMN